jgi:MerR family transcriptional regulator, heat shock protein HspR
MPEDVHEDEPMYVISVAARLVNMHPQTLRYYERAGLVNPTRSRGRIRLYSQRDIDRLRKIARLTDDLGVNLAGVEVILRLTERLEQVQHELEKHQIQLASDYTIEGSFVLEAETRPAADEGDRRHASKAVTAKGTTKSRRSNDSRGRAH